MLKNVILLHAKYNRVQGWVQILLKVGTCRCKLKVASSLKNRSLSLLLAARNISPGGTSRNKERQLFLQARLQGLSSDFERHESVVYCHKSTRKGGYGSQEGSATFQYTILKLCAQCLGLLMEARLVVPLFC